MLLLLNFKKSSEYSDSIINMLEENMLILIDLENYQLIFFFLFHFWKYWKVLLEKVSHLQSRSLLGLNYSSFVMELGRSSEKGEYVYFGTRCFAGKKETSEM